MTTTTEATADHRVECFHAADALRRAGKPIWTHVVRLKDVWGNEDLTFDERRIAIVRRLRRSSWIRPLPEDDYRREILDNLEDSTDVEEFDGWWDELYDYADADRVWIATS